MRVGLTALAMLAAVPAMAQNDAAALLDGCLAGEDAGESCIGSVSTPCLDAAGGEADAVAACYQVEATAWSQRLDAALATLKTDAEAADMIAVEEAAAEPAEADDADAVPEPEPEPEGPPAGQAAAPKPAAEAAISQSEPPVPSRVEALGRAQTAWVAWRDAECVWHGMGFDPQAAAAAEAECRMIRTAERVLALEPRGQAVDGP